MGSIQISPDYISDEEANYLAMELACGSALPMVIKTAIELDLFEIMAKAGPGALLSPKEIASQLPTTNPGAPVMVDRILRLLASYSVLTCSLRSLPDGKDERLYGLAPVCKFLTKNKDGASLSTMSLLIQDQVMMESWHYLKDAVLEGGVPFDKPHDMNIFQYLSKDNRLNTIFNKGMFDLSTIAMVKILEKYDGFEGIKTLVDVGGGTGSALGMIVSKYPTIKGINFDLPHVVKDAPTYPGVEHVGGDMFVSVPKGDAIFIRWVCPGFSDEHCSMFLRKCYEALPENGKVIIADSNLPDHPDSSFSSKFASFMDCFMMVWNTGKERTKKEFEALAKGAGFQGFQVKCVAFGTCIMEFHKTV